LGIGLGIDQVMGLVAPLALRSPLLYRSRHGVGKKEDMRLKSGIWVAAYIRRCQIEGAQAVLRRRGADEAGAVFIKVARLDGTAEVYGPAPQSTFDEARPADRAFIRSLKKENAAEADAEAYLARQIKFDPDVWIVEVEDRAGRNFLDTVVA
jgi:hypothetical protein